MAATDERVNELEARYMLQQDTLQKLSDVMWQQQQAIDALTARVKMLESRSSEPAGVQPSNDETPPHY